MEELLVFNTNPDEPHPPGTDVALTAGQVGGGAGEQVDVEPSTPLWPEWRDRTAEVQSESDQEEEREEQEWAENPESRTESVRQLDADQGSGKTEMEKWEDDNSDEGVWDGGDGSLADDEEEEDDDDEDLANWMPAKASYVFSPLVTIVLPPREQSEHNGERVQYEGTAGKVLEPLPETDQPPSNQEQPQQPQWIDTPQKPSRGCHHCCSEAMGMVGSLLLAAVIFPFLVWAGYKLLPFDTPSISTAPLRMVFTLRCAFFATFPIVLGLLVQGVSRLRFGVLKPLFSARQMGREVGVHGNYIKDSLQLSLLYFTQLAVTATYISQDLLKLVPLITIVFVFGRLIYWICVCLGSRVRALGFGLSFCPLLALLGLNLYFICSSNGQEAVFEVAPPTTPPPPKQRWWG